MNAAWRGFRLQISMFRFYPPRRPRQNLLSGRRLGSERADINIAARPHHAAAYFGWRTPRIVRSGVNAVAASGEELARRGGDGWRSEEATERQMGQTVLPQFPQGKPAGGPVKWARA